MYKIIIPPAITILIASIVVARLALAEEDAEMMHYAWGMAAFAGLAFASLLGDYLLKGLHNISEIEKAEISIAEYEREKDIEKLYSPTSHTEEWLDGFAQAASFMAENYLSGDRPGITENRWFKLMSEADAGLPDDPTLLEASYRAYMLAALMHRNGITFKEYDRIKQATRDTAGGKVIADTPYEPNLVDEAIENWRKSPTAKEREKHRRP